MYTPRAHEAARTRSWPDLAVEDDWDPVVDGSASSTIQIRASWGTGVRHGFERLD